MRFKLGILCAAILTTSVGLGHATSAQAQTPARSSVVIPLKKEKAASEKVVTIHDTVTMVRVDTVRIMQTIVHTDTVFRVDTLRDSCSRAAFPIPIPIPLSIDNGHGPPATLDPAPITTSVTPEPETLVLVGSGLATVLSIGRFRRRK
jgi:hypothetical protein